MARIEPTEIATGRLVLRPPEAQDAAAIQRLCDDWRVARMTARMPHPYDLADARDWIAAQSGLWTSADEFNFVITLDGAVVGGAGLNLEDDAYDLGYWIGEPWWGMGYATEAARALCDIAFGQIGVVLITAGHYAGNPASGRVLAKCGFRYTGERMLYCAARAEALPSLTMELAREDYARTAERTRP